MACIFIGGLIWLEIRMSKSQNKWYGLILPFVCFLFSLINVFSLASYSIKTETIETLDENGNVISTVTETKETSIPLREVATTAIPVFIFSNIPTLVLGGVYMSCREQIKKDSEIEKINIKDLQ